MSEKVKLTREQAEAVAIRRNMDMFEESVKCHIKGQFQGDENKALAELSLDEFIRALYIGYEVEETFGTGDNVVLDDGKVAEILSDWQCDDRFLVGWIANGSMYKEYVNEKRITRHATKQEVWWAKHGREVWELKDLDILINEKTGKMYEVNILADETIRLWKIGVDGAFASDYKSAKEISKYVEVLCFAEDRKDVDHA